jgi:cbb3-type cytochrome oxidase cytochrome c subunit
LVGLAFILVVAGCGGGSSSAPTRDSRTPTDPSAGELPPLSPELAKGRDVFIAQNCGNCHKINGAALKGTKGGAMGPDLGKVGSEPTHTVAWISDHIKDPKVHKPMSKMPGYEKKISQPSRALASTWRV